ncbi:DNA topoisomerase I [Candidatus Bathyarchaeota archaeon]|nr:DNA topoisomerase I [Candidatus Bathyarchaeota archaeon]
MADGKYTMIITEKPTASERIASALSDESGYTRHVKDNVPYYEHQYEGDRFITVSALGHLYTLTARSFNLTRDIYPIFNLSWVPKHRVNRKDSNSKRFIALISEIAENASGFISACDYDIEGSIIGYNILKYACNDGQDKAKRLKYSILTVEALRKAYGTLESELNFPLVEAGLARHELDFLYGVNLSRALMSATRRTGRHYTLSTGRVQGPTLKFLVEREKSIQSFVPTPFWTLDAFLKVNDRSLPLEFEQPKIQIKSKAESIVKTCNGKPAVINDIQVKSHQVPPPTPFDVGALQRQAYRFFKFTPHRSLQIAERLYLGALISYPRTSSQKLPPDIGFENILKGLSDFREYRNLALNILSGDMVPNEGKRVDSAHPAIYPTGKQPDKTLSGPERKLFDMIVRRFLAVFMKPAVKENVKIVAKYESFSFLLRGSKIISSGWMSSYGKYSSQSELLLPTLKRGEHFPLSVRLIERFSQPSHRYNPSSLLKQMDDQNIGTKATRSQIIKTLYDRGYINGDRIEVSILGVEVTRALEKYCSEILDVEMTRQLEEKMTLIEKKKLHRKSLLTEVVVNLKPVLANLKDKELELGKDLGAAIRKALLQRRILGPCPVCKDENILFLRSKRTGKQFAACPNKLKGLCTFSAPLPQNSTILPTGKPCPTCSHPVVLVKRTGRRPWNLCINLECPSKKNWKSKSKTKSRRIVKKPGD